MVAEERWPNAEKKAAVLESFSEMREEAHAQFRRYRAEVGLED